MLDEAAIFQASGCEIGPSGNTAGSVAPPPPPLQPRRTDDAMASIEANSKPKLVSIALKVGINLHAGR